MPNEALPNKREVMLALLAETSVFVHLDPRGPSVRIPPWFKNQPQLVLQIGLNMAVQIPDLDVSEQGISCTLSFSRRPFFCSIPWTSVFGLVGDNGPGLVWPDDVPAEIAAQVQAQAQAQPQPTKGQLPKGQAQKAAVREAPKGKLRAVGAERPAGEPSRNGSSQASAPPEGQPAPLPEAAPALAAAIDQPEPSSPSAETNAQPQASDAPKPQASDAPKPQASQTPAQSNRLGSKRELPPYLRVVK
jgi:hypothetical protein